MAEYRDPTHLTETEMQNINLLAEAIRHKTYGIDVRESIALAIELMLDIFSKENNDAVAEVVRARGPFSNLSERLNNLSVEDINKNLGKLDSTYFSDEFLSALAGGTINATNVLDDSLETANYIDKSVTFEKLSNAINFEVKDVSIELFDNTTLSGKYQIATLQESDFRPLVKNANVVYKVYADTDVKLTPAYFLGDKIVNKISAEITATKTDISNTVENYTQNIVNKLSTFDYEIVLETGVIKTGKYPLVELTENDFQAITTKKTNTIYKVLDSEENAVYFLGVQKISKLYKDTLDLTETNFHDKSNAIEDDKDFVHFGFSNDSANPIVFSGSDKDLSKIYDVKPNTTYTIYASDDADEFRYATYTSYPKVGDLPTQNKVADARVGASVTLKTGALDKFLLFKVSKTGHEPLQMGIAEGDEFKLDTISDSALPIHKNFYISGDIHADYTPITSADVLSETLTSSQVYAHYDALMAEFPEYITKTLLAHESTGLPIYRYDFKPPKVYRYEEDLPKILYITGTHAGEHENKASGIRLFSDVARNWESNELLKILRWNIHFIVIPVMNPFGMDNRNSDTLNGRLNANLVNLNRNFPIGWTYRTDPYNSSGPNALSEIESQTLWNLLTKEEGIKFALDHHTFDSFVANYNAGNRPFAMWAKSSDGAVNKILAGWARDAQAEFMKAHKAVEGVEVNTNYVAIVEELYAGGLQRIFKNFGITGGLLEFSADYDFNDYHTSELAKLFALAIKNFI